MDVIRLLTILVGFITMISFTVGFYFNILTKFQRINARVNQIEKDLLWVQFQLEDD